MLALGTVAGFLILASTPVAAQIDVTYTEDFEDETFGLVTPDESWYDINKTSSTVQIISEPTGGKRMRITPGAIGSLTFNFTGFDVCPGTIDFDLYHFSGSNRMNIQWDTQDNGSNVALGDNYVRMAQPSNDAAYAFDGIDTANNVLGETATGTDDPNNYHVAMTCSPGGPIAGVATMTGRNVTTELVVCAADDNPVPSCNPGSGSGVLLADLNFLHLNPFANSVIEIDNLTVVQIGVLDSAQNFWCSAPASTNFGFDFIEDVTRDTVDAGIEIDPYYKFVGASGDYGYLGKAFGGTQTTPLNGSTHMRSYLRIEAASDNAESNLRSSFTFTRANGTPDDPVMNKGIGTEAGDSTGDFARHIEARWWEQGNDWDIRLFYVENPGGVTVRTPMGNGQSFLGGSPNTPTSFIFDVDTVNQTAQVKTFAGQLLISQPIPAGYVDQEMYGHYFVGFHTDLGIAQDPRLALDEDWRTDYSTCLEDVNGFSAFNGDQGSDPFTPDIPGGNETRDDGGEEVDFLGVVVAPPPGFSVATFEFFLGILLMGAITGGFYFINNSALLAGIGAAVGFMLSFAFGLFPLWAVLLVALLAAAAFVLRFKSSSGG